MFRLRDRLPSRTHLAAYLSVGLALFTLVKWYQIAAYPVHREGTDASPTVGTMLETGQTTQLTMIVIGSASCGASRGSPLVHAILSVRDSLRTIGRRAHLPFASIIIAIDQDPDAALRWIRDVGRFDEVIAGQSLLNTGVIEYVWRNPPGVVSTPQIIVGLRTINRRGNRALEPPVMTLLSRMIGPRDILGGFALAELDSLLAGVPNDRRPASASPEKIDAECKNATTARVCG